MFLHEQIRRFQKIILTVLRSIWILIQRAYAIADNHTKSDDTQQQLHQSHLNTHACYKSKKYKKTMNADGSITIESSSREIGLQNKRSQTASRDA